MSKTVAQAQQEYRERRAARMVRMTLALQSIAELVDGKTGPVAVEVYRLAREGLA